MPGRSEKWLFSRHTKLIIKERTSHRSGTTSGEASARSGELRSVGAVVGGVEVGIDVNPVGAGVGGNKASFRCHGLCTRPH